MTRHRIGLIVPSSNVTMETELPALFRRRESVLPDRFSFHSARAPMTQVTPAALAEMNAHGARCAQELAHADCDVLAYACLVAVMAGGPGAHTDAEARLAAAAGGRTPVVTSAGALVSGIRRLGARRVAMIAPYAPALTAMVVDYLAAAGIEVVAAHSLNVTDNAAVGRLDPHQLLPLIDRLDLSQADALVLSACVQLPSLPALAEAERRSGLPVLTAATATAGDILDALGLSADIPGGGRLLARQAAAPALR